MPYCIRLSLIALSLMFATLAAPPPAFVSLNSSPNPAIYGQKVTLTATVTAGASGKVSFYDGVLMLGTSTISNSQAVFETRLLSAGSHSLKAYYAGDGTNGAAESLAIPQAVNALAANGFLPPQSYTTTTSTYNIRLADFNGDGLPDIITGRSASGVTIDLLAGRADGTFQAAQSTTLPASPYSLAVGDLNGDGKPDMVVGACATSIRLMALLGDGSGGFQTPATYAAGSGCYYGVVLGDFNHDGKPDVAASSSDGKVWVFPGNGDGTFGTPASYACSPYGVMAVGDLNGDGNADLVVGSGSYSSIYVLLGKADGTFDPAVGYPTSAAAGSMVIADFNGDGNQDVVVTSYSYASLFVLPGNGNGTLGAPTTGASLPSSISGIAAEDFNADGTPDIVALAYSYPTSATVAQSTRDGRFQVGSAIALPGSYSSTASAVVGDFNGDGRPDIAIVTGGTNAVYVLIGGPGADLTVSQTHSPRLSRGASGIVYRFKVNNVGTQASSGPVGVVASLAAGLTPRDISGNGWTCGLGTLSCTRSDSVAVGSSYPDIVITVDVDANAPASVTALATVSGGGDADSTNNFSSDTVNVLLASNITLAASANPSTAGQALNITATLSGAATGTVVFEEAGSVLGLANISGGRAILTTRLLTSGKHSIRAVFGGDATYGPAVSAPLTVTILPVANVGFRDGTSYPVATANVTAVGTADLNGDGALDLLMLASYSPRFVVALGKGDGTFLPAVTTALSNSFSTMQVADVNGDNKPDMVFSDTSNAILGIMLGNGNGTFGAMVTRTGVAGVLAVADFDGDGMADVVARLSNLSGTYLLTSVGDGTFRSPLAISLSPTPQSGAAGDFNGDGKPDVVFPITSGLSVLLGSGNGAFQAATASTFSGTNTCGSISVADFNNDGKADVLCDNGGWGLQLYTGRGDGTFNAPLVASTSSTASTRTVGDFDGDGNLDVATASYYGSTVVVLQGKGDGTFYPPVQFPAGPYYQYPVAGDFNGDGRPDLAVFSSGSNSLTVLLAGIQDAVATTVSEVGRFVSGRSGSAYVVRVRNSSFVSFSGTTVVQFSLPSGLTATAMTGSGWTCTLATLRCSRTDSLSQNVQFDDITINVAVGNLPAGTVSSSAVVIWSSGNTSTARTTRIYTPTTTALTASANPVVLGQSVTLTATINAATSGTVTFSDQGSIIGSAAVAGTQASLTTRLTSSGVRQLRATFNGNTTYAPSVSASLALPVVASPSSGFGAAVSSTVANGPVSIVAADFNRDGRTDLAVENTTGTVSILLGTGAGTFQTKVDYTVNVGSYYTYSLAAGDFDGDGNIDLLLPMQTGLVMFGGNGDGTFRPAVTYPVPPSVSSIYNRPLALTDMNADGTLDAVVGRDYELTAVSGGSNAGQVWTKLVSTSSSSSRIVMGDFNQDGLPDFVSSYYGIYTYLGSPNGLLTAGPYLSSNSPSDMAVGDMNGDGKPDLVMVTNSSSDGVIVYLGNGDGSFRPAQYFGAGTFYSAIALADVNGDGRLDVIATAQNSSQVALLLGVGDGTLQPSANFAVGSSPTAVVTGDFNGDGRTDLAVVNNSSNSVSILLGIYPPILNITAKTQGYLMRGQTGAQYTVTVDNAGPGVTTGTVIFTDTLPAGLTATAIEGTNWSCTLATLTCSRSDALAAAGKYPPITITLNVSGSAAAQVTNQLTVTGGGSPNATAGHLLTVLSPLSITGQVTKNGVPFGGVPVSISGGTSTSTITDASGNYYFSSLVSGGTYTVTPTLSGYRFSPPTATISGLTSGRTANFAASPSVSRMGIFRSGFWAVDTTGNAAWDATDKYVWLGQAGDVPVVGDFDGDGVPEMGIFRNGFWAIDMNHNGVWDASDRYLWLGQAGDVPVVGDFNGDGITEMGVFRSGFWAIDLNHNGVWDATDRYLWLGQSGDVPVVGDFNGDGIAEMGVFRSGFWAIDLNRNGVWDATDRYLWLGQAGDIPVVGNFQGDGTARMGIFRNGFWAIDLNSDGVWQGTDGYYWLGQTGDVPVVGAF